MGGKRGGGGGSVPTYGGRGGMMQGRPAQPPAGGAPGGQVGGATPSGLAPWQQEILDKQRGGGAPAAAPGTTPGVPQGRPGGRPGMPGEGGFNPNDPRSWMGFMIDRLRGGNQWGGGGGGGCPSARPSPFTYNDG